MTASKLVGPGAQGKHTPICMLLDDFITYGWTNKNWWETLGRCTQLAR